MDLTLTDRHLQPDGCFGKLIATATGAEWLRTLEHAYPLGGEGYTVKVQPGVYQCIRGVHSLAGHPTPFETFEVTEVPGHTGILFHVDNWNADSDGCILVGVALAPSEAGQMITQSKVAFERFMALQMGCDAFQLTVI